MTIALSSLKRHLLLATLLLIVGIGAGVVWAPRASAAYIEHNLIEDGKFLDAASMNEGQIQSFLDSRGGFIARYTPWSDRDNAQVPAARIIYEAAQDYGISPKVLLATMQKEQSLVTAKNPTESQLNFAMGYGCPDSTGCGTSYKGFYSQLDNASWQLRYNFERARGNNTWWRNSSSYACGGNTRYYSTGLYAGRYVTFYDEVGYGYKSFTINNGATASLYCYTPHAYPGHSGKYYSGSYNFVVKYEEWFGSTQPDVVITSPLRVSTLKEGMYAGERMTFSFDLQNTANYRNGIGSMMIAARDSQGRNFDFGLTPIMMEAFDRKTYSANITLPAEETYTFWITNKYGNEWRDWYPVSSYIDNKRIIKDAFVQAMPTITEGPDAATPDMLRTGKAATVGFKVKNNSARVLNLGKIGVAVRDPQGGNRDLPFENVSALAAGATYTYSKPFIPQKTGGHWMYLSTTKDNGQSWNTTDYPGIANGELRSIQRGVAPGISVTTGLATDTATPHVGQQTKLSFQVKNFGDSPANLGKMGLIVRDPQGANRDPWWTDVTVAAGATYTYEVPMSFNKTGTWSFELANYNADDGWNTSYPASETGSIVRKMTLRVAPSVTVTTGVAFADVAEPRVGKGSAATFTLTNHSDSAVYVGTVGLAARGPQGENLDVGWDQNVTIPAGGTYTYNKTAYLAASGTVWLWVSSNTPGVGWSNDLPLSEGNTNRALQLQVRPSPVLVTGVAASDPTPQVGQSVTMTFSVKNFGSSPASVGKLGLAVRDPQGANRDPWWDEVTIAPGATYTYSVPMTLNKAGNWSFELTNYAASRGWNTWYPINDASHARKLTLNVTP
jgi:hypothetical protein